MYLVSVEHIDHYEAREERYLKTYAAEQLETILEGLEYLNGRQSQFCRNGYSHTVIHLLSISETNVPVERLKQFGIHVIQYESHSAVKRWHIALVHPLNDPNGVPVKRLETYFAASPDELLAYFSQRHAAYSLLSISAVTSTEDQLLQLGITRL